MEMLVFVDRRFFVLSSCALLFKHDFIFLYCCQKPRRLTRFPIPTGETPHATNQMIHEINIR